jgi:hypothetical protein
MDTPATMPARVETLPRARDEDAADFEARVGEHVAARERVGWILQVRQEHDRSVDLVWVRDPER